MKKKRSLKKKKVEEDSEEKKISRVENKNQDKTLLWFFIFVALMFSAFLIPYFYIKNGQTFEYLELNWTIEKEPDITFYYSRIPFFSGQNTVHNLYLVNDPRKNGVEALGEFNRFKRNLVISFSPEASRCTGEFNRGYLTLSSFLKNPVGLRNVYSGLSDEEEANLSEKFFANCETAIEEGISVVIIQKGEKNFVEQDIDSPYCHIITLEDCEDTKPIEKFILKLIEAANN